MTVVRWLIGLLATLAVVGSIPAVSAETLRASCQGDDLGAAHALVDSGENYRALMIARSLDVFVRDDMAAVDLRKLLKWLKARAELSACKSGLGQAHDGGVIGLARAFQVAGAAQVAISLWSVDDQATEALMGVFVEGLTAGRLAPAEALRAAMLARRKVQPMPFHWASFTLFGVE